jgi:hypothetical protein
VGDCRRCQNNAASNDTTVDGGLANTAGGENVTVGGSEDHTASGPEATITGGRGYDANNQRATVGGGSNDASGVRSAVPDGINNSADGSYSSAAGDLAQKNGHDEAFVFDDSSSTSIQARSPDEVRSQMVIYASSFYSTSSRAAKTDIEPVDP